MSTTFPAQRNFTFSKTLMNLKVSNFLLAGCMEMSLNSNFSVTSSNYVRLCVTLLPSVAFCRLQFMRRTTGEDTETTSSHSKVPATGQALTMFESNRREMELRQQLPGFNHYFLLLFSFLGFYLLCCSKYLFRMFRVEEEFSLTRLYDLVLGRFSFHGINPQIEVRVLDTLFRPERLLLSPKSLHQISFFLELLGR